MDTSPLKVPVVAIILPPEISACPTNLVAVTTPVKSAPPLL